MKHRTILFFAMLASISDIAFAQKAATGDSLIFSGNFVHSNGRPNSINISYRLDDGFDITRAIRIKKDIDNKGYFTFNLPNLGKIYQIYISAKLGDSASGRLFDETYYAEPGDSINININNYKENGSRFGMIQFSGKGNEKYNLISELKRLQAQSYEGEPIRRKLHPDSIKGSWKRLNSILDSIATLARKYELKKKYLIENAAIDSRMKKVIGFEYARFKNEWFIWSSFYYRSFPEYREQIRNKYLQYQDGFLVEPDDDLSVYSSKYFIYECSRIGFELELLNNSNLASMKSFYNHVKSSYTGKVQQKMIGYIFRLNVEEKFFKTASNFVKDSLLKDALKIVMNPYIKCVLQEEAIKYSLLAKKVINGEFINLNGTKFELESLRGKVVLIESWFVGCGPCAMLHAMFEKDVYPKFKHNKDFVVLSINIDKQEKNWREGLKSGKYTSDHYINVRNSLEFEHPFFKFYGIMSNPMMMLIGSDGFIQYKPKSTSAEVLTEQIDVALKRSVESSIRSSL